MLNTDATGYFIFNLIDASWYFQMNMKYEEFSHLDVYVLCQLLFSSMTLASEYDGLSPLWFAS